MEKIAKVYTYSQATAYGKAALFMSLPFIGLGAFFALGGFSLIPLPFKGFPRSPIFGAFGATFSTSPFLGISVSKRDSDHKLSLVALN